MIPEVTPEIIRAWKHNFPAIDVELELCRIELWLAKHPSRKYKRPIRMVETWLKRAEANLRKREHLYLVNDLTEREVIAHGREKGIFARPGESSEEFARRVRAAYLPRQMVP